MKLPPRKIWPYIGVTVAAVAIAFPPFGGKGETAATAKNSPQLSQSVSSQPAATPQPKLQLGRVELEKLNQQGSKSESGHAITNAFKSTSWYIAPPPPPPPPPPPAPVPTAPPVPFTYVGRYQDPPKLLVILAVGSKMYTVSTGDVIDDNYRVDRITDSAVDLVYLPLNINQSISTIAAPETTQHRPSAEERYRRQ